MWTFPEHHDTIVATPVPNSVKRLNRLCEAKTFIPILKPRNFVNRLSKKLTPQNITNRGSLDARFSQFSTRILRLQNWI